MQTAAIDLVQITQSDYINYSRNEVHSHSKAVQKFYDLLTNYISYLENLAKTRPVVWVNGANWAAQLLYSSGATPAFVPELGRYATRDILEISENYFQMPVEVCSMVRSTIGGLYSRKDGPIKRILVQCGSCEPFNMSYEALRKEGYDVHSVDVIYRAYGIEGQRFEELIQYFIKEIKSAYKWLTGNDEIDKDSLRAELARSNTVFAKYRKILELRKTHPYHIRSLPFRMLAQTLWHYFGRPEEYIAMLDELIYELEHASVNESDIKKAIPLIWSGGGGQEFGVFQVIDETDGVLISFPQVQYNRDYDLSLDPLEAIARFNLGGDHGGASIYRVGGVEREYNKFNARGLIIYGYVGCSFSSVEHEIMRNYFHEKGVPMLILEGTYQIGPPTGQTITRIKAFMDMLG
jgi:benzoyl-CoA reductase/2-hydroxyglutaryl-CoA dehydratase subunit BcrC/BadD/HgdB